MIRHLDFYVRQHGKDRTGTFTKALLELTLFKSPLTPLPTLSAAGRLF